jgi:2-dehydro-3-deoxygluconokinase
MVEVVTLGECLAVLYPPEPIEVEAAGSLTIDIGGAEGNLAIALSRLGHRARVLGRVGDDPFGRRIRTTLDDEGVDATFLLTDAEAPTGLYIRAWLPDGVRRVYYYRTGSAGSRLAPQDLTEEAFTGARIVHLTGITPALTPSCAAAIARAIELAHQAGALVSFDPNYRRRLWDETTAQEALLPLMRQADILLMGDEDARALLSEGDDQALLMRGAALGPQVVVLKCAERGALALADAHIVSVPAEPIAHVIDPVGAGDGFDAGFLAGWLQGASLGEMLRLGARVGAAAVAALGDYSGYPRSTPLAWRDDLR